MLIPSKDNISTVTDMRVDAIKFLKDVQKKGMKYIFQRSRPQAVVLSMKEFKTILEKLEDWEDQQLVYKLEKEDHGEGTSLEDLAKEYGIKL